MHAALIAAAAGLGTGLSLIVAIGSQNAFVLRQGILRRRHVPAVVTICAVSNAVLIAGGVAGLGALVRAWPGLITAVAWAGAAFLTGYGLLAARRALRPGRLAMADGGRAGVPARLGAGPASASPGSTRMCTWTPCCCWARWPPVMAATAGCSPSAQTAASVLWFTGLGFGARLLRPLFSRPGAWRGLDLLIAATMLTLGTTLALRT